MLPKRRHLALVLPRWATDQLERHEPELRLHPLGLYEREGGAMRIAALNEKAERSGINLGQSLADARAMLPSLVLREIDRLGLAQSFAALADWHSYASPIVAIGETLAPFGDLMLDITGVAHLFGGETAMLRHVTGRLERESFAVQGAIADTLGAAWALARFAPDTVADGSLHEHLSNLPLSALRLSPAQLASLNQLGLKRIGQLGGQNRKALQARFGLSLLQRLDQALGILDERLVPRLPHVEHYAERRFPDPIALLDDIRLCARDLAVQLGLRLEAAGLGAQSFHLFLFRVDHRLMRLSVNAARPTREPKHVARLFENRLDRLVSDYDPGFGIDMIRLGAGSLSPLRASQSSAFAIPDGGEHLDQLYDRMASRLGPLAVLRTKFFNSHIPERAVLLEAAIARTEDDPVAAPDPAKARPVRLLPNPEPITVSAAEVPDGPPPLMVWRRVSYRFVHASGPERISAEWWRPGEGALTRDYFIAEDETGRRFWIFREGLYAEAEEPRWFLHGFFS